MEVIIIVSAVCLLAIIMAVYLIWQSEDRAIEKRKLKEIEIALENLIEAIPPETLDADWWGDDLKRAIKQAKTFNKP